jgi:hypothetical protein
METAADRLMQAIEDQKKIDGLSGKQKLVYEVIQRTPEAANSEALLLERYWVEVDNWDETKSLYWNLQRVTRPATIERRRRELFNLGLIEYSPEALKSRTEAFKKEVSKHSGHETVKAQIVSPRLVERDGEMVVVL